MHCTFSITEQDFPNSVPYSTQYSGIQCGFDECLLILSQVKSVVFPYPKCDVICVQNVHGVIYFLSQVQKALHFNPIHNKKDNFL